MEVLVRDKSGQYVPTEVPDAEVHEHFLAGNVFFKHPEERIKVTSPDGETGTIAAKDAEDFFRQGGRVATPDEYHKAVLRNKYGGPSGAVKAAVAGLGRGVSMSGTDVAARALGGKKAAEELSGLKEEWPILSAGTELAGAGIPALFTGGESALAEAPELAPEVEALLGGAKTVTTPAAKAAAEGIPGVLNEIRPAEQAAPDLSAKNSLDKLGDLRTRSELKDVANKQATESSLDRLEQLRNGAPEAPSVHGVGEPSLSKDTLNRLDARAQLKDAQIEFAQRSALDRLDERAAARASGQFNPADPRVVTPGGPLPPVNHEFIGGVPQPPPGEPLPSISDAFGLTPKEVEAAGLTPENGIHSAADVFGIEPAENLEQVAEHAASRIQDAPGNGALRTFIRNTPAGLVSRAGIAAKEAVGELFGDSLANSAAGRIIQGAIQEGVDGAVQNGLFQVANESSEDALGDHDLNAQKLLYAFGHGALMGAAFGDAMGAAGATGGELLRKVAPKISELSRLQALKAFSAGGGRGTAFNKKALRNIAGGPLEVADTAFKYNLLDGAPNIEELYGRTEATTEKVGQALGEYAPALDQVTSKLDAKEPAGVFDFEKPSGINAPKVDMDVARKLAAGPVGESYTFRYVPISEVTHNTAPWSEGKLEALRKRMKSEPIEPIMLTHTDGGALSVGDGIHRLNVAKEMGYTHVPAFVEKLPGEVAGATSHGPTWKEFEDRVYGRNGHEKNELFEVMRKFNELHGKTIGLGAEEEAELARLPDVIAKNKAKYEELKEQHRSIVEKYRHQHGEEIRDEQLAELHKFEKLRNDAKTELVESLRAAAALKRKRDNSTLGKLMRNVKREYFDENGNTTFTKLRDARIHIQKLVNNWTPNPYGGLGSTDQVLYKMIRGHMENAFVDTAERVSSKMGSNIKNEYVSLKDDYRKLKFLQERAENSLAAHYSNHGLSLTSKMLGMTAWHGGGPQAAITGMAIAGMHKMIRDRGNAASALMLDKLAQLAFIQRSTAKVDRAMEHGVDGLFARIAGKEGKKAPSRGKFKIHKFSGPAENLEGVKKPTEARDRSEENMYRASALAGLPGVKAEHVSQALGLQNTHAPKTMLSMARAANVVSQYLVAQLPKSNTSFSEITGPHPGRLSDSELATYNDKHIGATDIHETMARIAKGRVTTELIQGMQANPKVLDQFRQGVMERLAEMKPEDRAKIPFQNQVELGIILNTPTTWSMQPSSMKQLQANDIVITQSDGRPTQDQKPGRMAPARLGNKPLNASMKTTMDKIEGSGIGEK